MFPRTFRATSTVVAFWIAVGFAALLVGDAIVRGAWGTVVGYLPPVLWGVWLLWVALWRTNVRAEPERLLVTNMVRIHDVPWDRVVGVQQRGQVTLELEDAARLVCWGAPFPPRPGLRRTERRRASDFATILDHYRSAAPPSSEPVTRRWDLVAIVPGVVLTLVVVGWLVARLSG